MARPRLGPQRQPWKGIDANERAYNTVHNALVGIILDGVTGVSPDIGHRQIAPEKADEYLERGRRVLADFESQNPAPGGSRGRAQFWMENKIRELKRLLSDAEAVRSGARPQKQTPESYGELRKHLGVASPGKSGGLSVGDHVTAEWTWGHQRFQAAGEIAKVSGKTVKVKLTEDAGGHFKPGFIVTTSTEHVHKSGDTEVWGIWDAGRKQWMPDPLKGHIDTSPARYKSKTEAERKADRDWRALNPGERFEVRPLSEARRVEAPKRDRRRDQYVYVDDLRAGDVIYADTGEATVVSVSDSDSRGYRNVEVNVNGGRKTLRYYGESTVPIKRRSGGVREGHRVADYDSRDANIEVFFPDERFAKTHQGWVGVTLRAPLIAQGAFAGGYHMLWGPIRTSEYRTLEGRIYAKLGNAVRVSLVERQRTTIDDMRETSHRVADFNTLDDLARHARGEGATHIMHIDDEVHLYFRRSDGKYEKAEVWQKDGYWHTQAPGSRAVVQKPPQGAKPIGGRGTTFSGHAKVVGPLKIEAARLPSATHRRTARGGKMREDPPPDAEAAGAQYAEDQINSDYFLDWVRDQLAEAADMDPSEVLPLETQADAMEIAKNMFQQLKWDTSRDLEPREIARLIGVDDTTREDVKEFFKGFRETLDTNRAWLAEELLRLKGEMK